MTARFLPRGWCMPLKCVCLCDRNLILFNASFFEPGGVTIQEVASRTGVYSICPGASNHNRTKVAQIHCHFSSPATTVRAPQLLRSNPYHGLITTSSFSSITRQILIRRGSLSDFDIPALLTPVYHWTNGHGAAGFGAPLSVSRSTPNFRLTSSEGGSTCISSLLYDPLDQGRQTPTLGITLVGLKEHNISSSSKCALPGLVIGWSYGRVVAAHGLNNYIEKPGSLVGP